MSFIVEFTPIMIIVSLAAFVFEFMDASLGMGFGTTLTPILLIFGYDAKFIVPAVLLSELCAGTVAVISHSLLKNIKLGQKRIFKRRKSGRKQKKSSPYRVPGTIVVPTSAVAISSL